MNTDLYIPTDAEIARETAERIERLASHRHWRAIKHCQGQRAKGPK